MTLSLPGSELLNKNEPPVSPCFSCSLESFEEMVLNNQPDERFPRVAIHLPVVPFGDEYWYFPDLQLQPKLIFQL